MRQIRTSRLLCMGLGRLRSMLEHEQQFADGSWQDCNSPEEFLLIMARESDVSPTRRSQSPKCLWCEQASGEVPQSESEGRASIHLCHSNNGRGAVRASGPHCGCRRSAATSCASSATSCLHSTARASSLPSGLQIVHRRRHSRPSRSRRTLTCPEHKSDERMSADALSTRRRLFLARDVQRPF